MDFAQAKKIFAGYLKQYDTKNDKIRLKIVHTYGVVDAARLIAEGLGLSGRFKPLDPVRRKLNPQLHSGTGLRFRHLYGHQKSWSLPDG